MKLTPLFTLSATTIALVAVTATTSLLGQTGNQNIPVNNFTPSEAAAGITVHANEHNFFSCENGGTISIENNALQNVRFWAYEFTGQEPPFNGNFYISPKELAVNSQYASMNNLATFSEGKRYYLMSEEDLSFRCGEGLAPKAYCGDGVIQNGEECDDGDTQDGNGCDASCNVELGYSCDGEPSACSVLLPELPGGQQTEDQEPTLSTATVDDKGNLSITYSKDFDACLDLYTIPGGKRTINSTIICDSGTRITREIPANKLSTTLGKGDIIRLCKADDPSFCSNAFQFYKVETTDTGTGTDEFTPELSIRIADPANGKVAPTASDVNLGTIYLDSKGDSRDINSLFIAIQGITPQSTDLGDRKIHNIMENVRLVSTDGSKKFPATRLTSFFDFGKTMDTEPGTYQIYRFDDISLADYSRLQLLVDFTGDDVQKGDRFRMHLCSEPNQIPLSGTNYAGTLNTKGCDFGGLIYTSTAFQMIISEPFATITPQGDVTGAYQIIGQETVQPSAPEAPESSSSSSAESSESSTSSTESDLPTNEWDCTTDHSRLLFWDRESNTCTETRPLCSDPDTLNGADGTLAQSRVYGFGSNFPRTRRGLDDFCATDSILVEYSCTGDYFWKESKVTCPSGVCTDGHCTEGTAPEKEPPVCTDSDGPNNYNVKGTASIGNESGTDYCESSDTVVEYNCASGRLKTKKMTCGLGCADGACLTQYGQDFSNIPPNVCADNDGGPGSKYEKGSTFYNGSKRTDYCEDDTTLNEVSCGYVFNGHVQNTAITCPYGCKDGACLRTRPASSSSSKSSASSAVSLYSCNDTDGGAYDYYVKGTAWVNDGNKHPDYCQDDKTLQEASCSLAQDPMVQYRKIPCPYGCKDGACQYQIEDPPLPPYNPSGNGGTTGGTTGATNPSDTPDQNNNPYTGLLRVTGTDTMRGAPLPSLHRPIDIAKFTFSTDTNDTSNAGTTIGSFKGLIFSVDANHVAFKQPFMLYNPTNPLKTTSCSTMKMSGEKISNDYIYDNFNSFSFAVVCTYLNGTPVDTTLKQGVKTDFRLRAAVQMGDANPSPAVNPTPSFQVYMDPFTNYNKDFGVTGFPIDFVGSGANAGQTFRWTSNQGPHVLSTSYTRELPSTNPDYVDPNLPNPW